MEFYELDKRMCYNDVCSFTTESRVWKHTSKIIIFGGLKMFYISTQ